MSKAHTTPAFPAAPRARGGRGRSAREGAVLGSARGQGKPRLGESSPRPRTPRTCRTWACLCPPVGFQHHARTPPGPFLRASEIMQQRDSSQFFSLLFSLIVKPSL